MQTVTDTDKVNLASAIASMLLRDGHETVSQNGTRTWTLRDGMGPWLIDEPGRPYKVQLSNGKEFPID